ncbi:DUF3888 domain-containing protein [Bacillus sp. FJAT-49705]|uniref:DUF3888 domain-containing protein n=1 Tax=Cytobacillus citreus TaxID=2833586 RepID=A0ABS5NW40_9BACI|nr:DUF3888 domain-containing protein [Cytobacillus citreus]MBS4192054.1 DUF3888 domain-containing protein [Cytobacillus citreus]
MRRFLFTIFLTFSLIFTWHSHSIASNANIQQDSKELMIQDILMLFLGEPIEKAVNEYYSKLLTINPLVYPYQIDVIKVERLGGFRTFHFKITLEVTPVVGAHNSVGKDRITFEIAPTIPSQVKLMKYEHLETHELPPNWQEIIR